MPVHTIGDGIYCIFTQDPELAMFDSLMPTSRGTTYNAYVIKTPTKSVLIDTAEASFSQEFIQCLKSPGIGEIDYLVMLHTEQDHSGIVNDILKRHPSVQLVATKEVAALAETHLHLSPDQFMIMEDGASLDLGEKSLRFMKIPFAHWPDNTMVYEEDSGILFSSDLFGSHYTSDKIFATNSHENKAAARGYFSEIMIPFSSKVVQYVQKVREINPLMIAPSHGPVWSNPSLILHKYEKWTSSRVDKMVVIPYVSMHGSSNAIMERLTWRLARRGLSVLCRDLGQQPEKLTIESGQVMYDCVTAAAVIFVGPTVLGGMHPAMAYCATLMNTLRPKVRFLGFVGSYGWATKADEMFGKLTGNMTTAKMIDPMLFKGLPTEEEFLLVDEYADSLADSIIALGDDLL